MNETRRGQVGDLLARRGAEVLLLEQPANHAAFLAARTWNGLAPEPPGRVAILVPADPAEPPVVVANRTELQRVLAEEVPAAVGRPYCWADPGARDRVLAELTRGRRVAADVPGWAADLSRELWRLRASLLPAEVEAYRRLGADCAAVMESCARATEPGHRELDAAARIARGLVERDILPAFVFVAADDRLRFRHAVPSPRRIDRHVQLSLTASRQGRFASLTRIVHFGDLPADLAERQRIAAAIDAHAIAATRPGAVIGDVFAEVVDRYAAFGWADEWREHHQGGPTGYAGRELKAGPEVRERVRDRQAWAWNPTIGAGAKSEDTVLVTASGHEVLTPTPLWPDLVTEAGGTGVRRSGVLVL